MDLQTPPCNTSGSQCGVQPVPYALIIIPVLLAVTTAVVVVLVVYSVCCKRREPAGTPVSYSNSNGATVGSTGAGSVLTGTVSGALGPARDALGPWEIPEDAVLKELDFLHTGRYGPVCQSQLTRGQVTSAVVVKTLRDSTSQAEVKEFVNWAQFHTVVSKHENLVQMLFFQTRRLPMYLVLEAVSPGNLLHFLWTLHNEDPGTPSQSQQFSERSVFLVAKQVAAGLEYLHSEHRLVHGDVAARSVLIGAGLSVRVTGLGMAFEAWESGKVAKRRAAEVPLKWQAPERIMRLPMTTSSDVWSFGILLYELVTLGAPPYPELQPLDVFPKIQNSYRMKKPEHCGTPLYDLMKYCWMWNSHDRPTFSTIIRLLRSYIELADTTPLSSQESVDIFVYSKKAGVFP
ncbi:tyrosine-protein kinase STYK1 isoform X2 [Anguilla rostrata]|uniref:tyrosine-protein kinase STYK1 isoform X2 n=1 Tax=Anguilla rostrata TaxID=7938 RepID=UPI0030D41F7D